jgi:ribonuclease-3 family protein
MKKQTMQNLNTVTLAYMGDAVYELYLRKYVIDTGVARADRLHRAAVRYVKAEAQANAIKQILDGLSEEEQTVVRRAHNHKPNTKPKNADPVDYKWATALEALIGWHYLAGRIDRVEDIVLRAIQIIEETT